jgi:alpha-tubulin suppressor-like RCC1 family protein
MNMSVGATSESICAITFDSRLKCWGSGASGRLGTGTLVNVGHSANEMGNFLMYTNVGTGRSVRQVSSSQNHMCAVLDNGQLKCWGTNTQGVLGQGHTNTLGDGSGEMGDYLPAVNLGTGRSAVQVSV